MKTYLLIFSIALGLGSCATSDSASGDTGNKSSLDLGKNYGPVKVDPKLAVSAGDMVKTQDNSEEAKEYTFEGTITEVCSKAGCWVNVETENGDTFMVRFKDHFTIPTDTKPGTKAYFHGEAKQDVISVEMLQHFAEDAGKSTEEIEKITEPKKEISFIADGIVLVK